MITKIFLTISIFLGLNLYVSAQEKLKNKVPPVELEKIEDRSSPYDDNGTITFINFKFKSQKLPSDLKDSKIGYVNLTKEQYKLGEKVNQVFAKKMEKYPHPYTIADNIEGITDCKYRVRLKKVKMNYSGDIIGPAPGIPPSSGYTKDLFFLFLEDMQTGERYKFQKRADFFRSTCNDFIKAVK